MKRLFVDIDGTLANWMQACSIEDCFLKGYFEKLSPQESIIFMIKRFLKNHEDVEVYVLSSVLDTPYAIPEKKKWLKKWIPEIEEDKYIFVPYGEEKNKYIKNINKDDYLLDDYTINLLAWHKAGGTGIKCKTHSNNTNKTWKGPYIHIDFPPILLDEMLENIIYNGNGAFYE